MALLGLTSAQAKLTKWLIRAAGEGIPAGLAWLANDLVGNAASATELEWRRFNIVWNRATPTGTVEDLAQFKLDLVNITADELDTTWNDADYAAVKAAIQTFVTAQAPRIIGSQTFTQVRGYQMKFNPVADVTRPFADSGPPRYVSPLTTAGTGSATQPLPYQVAPTVTLRTSWAKHWGRSYMPTPGSIFLDSYGRLTPTYMTGTGTAYKAMIGTLHDAGFYPVIPVGQLDKQPFHGLLGITQVVVDDVPDIQRRRRPKQAAVRQVA